MPVPTAEDYYMVIEVVQTATPEQIKQSYKRLAKKLRPDRNDKHDATEAFQRVCRISGKSLVSIFSLRVLK